MVRWFVSDHHLWHENIIKYCARPFANVKEMNEALLTYHNERVKPEDHVYFLGDVTLMRGGRVQKAMFCEEVRKYHGHKTLFLGNHDHWPVEVYREAGFEKVRATWRDEDGLLYSHIPIHPASMSTAKANVHGHIHNNQGNDFKPVLQVNKEGKVFVKPYINVSVEVINYRPISFEELMVKVEEAKNEHE